MHVRHKNFQTTDYKLLRKVLYWKNFANLFDDFNMILNMYYAVGFFCNSVSVSIELLKMYERVKQKLKHLRTLRMLNSI